MQAQAVGLISDSHAGSEGQLGGGSASLVSADPDDCSTLPSPFACRNTSSPQQKRAMQQRRQRQSPQAKCSADEMLTSGLAGASAAPEFWQRSSDRTAWTARHGRFCGASGRILRCSETEALITFDDVPMSEVEAASGGSTIFTSLFRRLGFVSFNSLQRTLLRHVPCDRGTKRQYAVHVPLQPYMKGEKITAVIMAALPQWGHDRTASWDRRAGHEPTSLIITSSDEISKKMRYTLDKVGSSATLKSPSQEAN
eukprot:SAG31_NODE_8035_length_1536_cov_1.192763_2_plen_254_part_00